MDVRVGLWRRLSAEELMLLTVVLEKTLERPLYCKEIQPVHSEGDQPWDFFGRNDAKAETPVLWPPHMKSWLIGKDSDTLEGLGAGGEGDDRGWDGWMASLTWCTWVWVNSGSWWWTGRPGVLWFMGLQRVRHKWVNWTECPHCGVCISELFWAFSFWKSCKRLIGKKGKREERKEGRKEEGEEARKEGKKEGREGKSTPRKGDFIQWLEI